MLGMNQDSSDPRKISDSEEKEDGSSFEVDLNDFEEQTILG